MSTHFVYASQYSYLLCCLMYVSGLPILYIFCSLFFAGYFVIYKFLLLKSYRVTQSFNQQIPIEATRMISWGVILHCCFGVLLYGNANLITSHTTVRAFVDTGENIIAYIVGRSTNFSLAVAFFVSAIIICVIICINAFFRSLA